MCYMFCIPELCSEMQFSNLAKVWFFGTLFLRCVYLNNVFTWTMLRLKLIIPGDWVRVFPSSLKCPWIMRFFQHGWWKQILTIPGLVWALGAVVTEDFKWCGTLFTNMYWLIFSWISEGDHLQICRVLSTALSSPVRHPTNSSCLDLPGLSTLSS